MLYRALRGHSGPGSTGSSNGGSNVLFLGAPEKQDILSLNDTDLGNSLARVVFSFQMNGQGALIIPHS